MNSSAFMDNLRQLFVECDSDNNGSLGRHEFRQLCTKIGLSLEAADETFERLDVDCNNRITFDEFAAGFNQYKQSASHAAEQPAPSSPTGLTHSQSSSRLSTRVPAGGASLSGASSASSVPSAVASRSPSNGRPTPSPVAARARKAASPIGVLSLGGGAGGGSGSSGNLTSATSDYQSDSLNQPQSALPSVSRPHSGSGKSLASPSEPPMVVYSAEASGGGDFDSTVTTGSSNNDQFGSLLSGSGSLNQVRNMQDLLECVQKLQSENQILTQIFFKDKREREELISQLGEEFDQQVREVEERANRRAREELDTEKKRLREMMQAERETLEHHYQTIEKMSNLIKTSQNGPQNSGGSAGSNNDTEQIDKVRSRLEDTFLENRQLKKSLLDTKSDVASIRKEMERLKQQYEVKLSTAYERNNETKSECEHIKQQLGLMKDSNRKLQDASDVLTTYITDKVEPVINAADEDLNYLSAGGSGNHVGGGVSPGSRSQASSRRGSILSEYLQQSEEARQQQQQQQQQQAAATSGRGPASPYGDSDAGDCDSLASSRGALSERQRGATPAGPPASDKASISAQTRQQTQQPSTTSQPDRRPAATTTPSTPSANSSSSSNNNNDDKQLSEKAATAVPAPETASKPSAMRMLGRHLFASSRTQSDADKSKDSAAAPLTAAQKVALAATKSISVDQAAADEPLVEAADGPSKSTFNIILVGDSFVGKSSFAARFMEGSFVQGLISNCSIDFKTKSYKVDGVNYTINLWDTAGQERFRSITASYFRKADGIILMYDVTDKRSYLNVRNWMSTIHDTAAENVAVLLIGNKIDLRREDNKHQCVPAGEGLRLAREYDIVCLETSVKNGTNLVPSMGRLIRLIAKSNMPEEDQDRIRLNDKSRAFACMPKNC